MKSGITITITIRRGEEKKMEDGGWRIAGGAVSRKR